jgi:hypothetical protein
LWCAQVIGVGASVIGDMSSRPNWGLNELDFVFATLVVSSKAAAGRGLRTAVLHTCWQLGGCWRCQLQHMLAARGLLAVPAAAVPDQRSTKALSSRDCLVQSGPLCTSGAGMQLRERAVCMQHKLSK